MSRPREYAVPFLSVPCDTLKELVYRKYLVCFSPMKSSSPRIRTWLKRIAFLAAAAFCIFGFLGEIQLSHPFLKTKGCFPDVDCLLIYDQTQVLLLISFIVSGVLLWSLWDNRPST